MLQNILKLASNNLTCITNNHHALLLLCLWGGWVVVQVVAGLVGVFFGIRLELIKRLMVSWPLADDIG